MKESDIQERKEEDTDIKAEEEEIGEPFLHSTAGLL